MSEERKQTGLTVGRLKELLSQIPDDALVEAYEGEDIGINIHLERGLRGQYWWIRAYVDASYEEKIEGFDR